MLANQRQVLSIMAPQSRDRFLGDVFPREAQSISSLRPSIVPPVTLDQRAAILRSLVDALEQLQVGLIGHDLELHWIDQLLAFVYRLQTAPPAATIDEQFQHTYMLRKWLFCC